MYSFCLASFTQHNYFAVHGAACINTSFFFFFFLAKCCISQLNAIYPSLSILLKDIWVLYSFWLLQIKLKGTFMHMSLHGDMFSFLLSK